MTGVLQLVSSRAGILTTGLSLCFVLLAWGPRFGPGSYALGTCSAVGVRTLLPDHLAWPSREPA